MSRPAVTGRIRPGPRQSKFEIPTIARYSRAPCPASSAGDGWGRGRQLNEHTLSMRLERVAAHVPAGARLADIGSDHAYLPVALMRRGAIVAAVAGEVALTPFHAAVRTVRDNDLQQHISVRLASGLTAIEPSDGITAISLCGMGGETIRDILDSGKARMSGHERLILQPNGGEQPLRQWLMDNGYRILDEEVLQENRFFYEIIVAERSGPLSYSAEQLYFGPLQMQARSPAFLAKWQRSLRQKQKTLNSFKQARQAVPEEKLEEVARQVQWITELLA
ncbi:tRNA (adenine(22)-N(1))-methyltransferase TrmK [Pseudomonas sp. 13B_3.2_Bac1]|nr:tRNA (adenine(22)-N(1))-methyltransferase TrmK [Pseudomonas sp. 13B_3.2_Bac1]